MAPPRSPDPRVPELQRQLAREIAERKQNEARLRKQNHALSVFNLMNVDVEQKATSLRSAATRIGTAYSVAAGRHKDALAKQDQVKAMGDPVVVLDLDGPHVRGALLGDSTGPPAGGGASGWPNEGY